MQRRYFFWAATLGIVIFGTITFAVSLLWVLNRQPAPNRVITAAQQENIKKQIVHQDILQTSRMFTTDLKRDIEMLMSRKEGVSGNPSLIAQEFMKVRPHFVYMRQIKDGAIDWEKGTTPKNKRGEINKRLSKYIRMATIKVMKQQSFTSPEVVVNGKSYIVIGAAAPQSAHGIVVLVNQHVIQTVRKQQLKNLRLIPYPPESKYRVRSVDSNSMQDVKVKNGTDNAGTTHYYENELAVRFRSNLSPIQFQRIMKDTGCVYFHKLGYTYVIRSNKMTIEQLTAYFKKFNPIYMEPHFLYMTNRNPSALSSISSIPSETHTRAVKRRRQVTEEPNDTLYKTFQWNLPNILTNSGWGTSKGATDIIIAVLDTGVDTNHRDLQDKLLKGYNVFNPGRPPLDKVGHGTHVAGIIGAKVNNEEGIAGMTWYNPILPVKVLDNSGAGTSYSVAKGIIWATDKGAKVINLSLGNYVAGAFLHDAIKYAFDRNVVLVAATGNDNTRRPGYPAAYSEVFAVSATDVNQKRANFSNYGDYIDVVAPGTSIASTYPSNQYVALSGTSMACPHVSALAALICSVNPSLRNTEVYNIMRQSVVDLGIPGKDIHYGYGRINVLQALNLARQDKSSLPPPPQNIIQRIRQIIVKLLHFSSTHSTLPLTLR